MKYIKLGLRALLISPFIIGIPYGFPIFINQQSHIPFSDGIKSIFEFCGIFTLVSASLVIIALTIWYCIIMPIEWIFKN